MSDEPTKTTVHIRLSSDFVTLTGKDMDFGFDERGYLTVYDYSLMGPERLASGTVFIAAPGAWHSASFA